MSTRTPAIAVYDLDGVITTRDSFTSLLLRRLLTAPHRLFAARTALVDWARARDHDAEAAASRRITSIALKGLTAQRYHRLAHRAGRRIGRSRSWIRAETLRRMEADRACGRQIVVATASEQTLARSLLEAAGAPFDVLSASALVETAAGMEVADHRIGARKAAALEERGITLGDAEFFTDSTADLPTARLARSVVLVGASDRTQAAFAQAGVRVTRAGSPR